MLKQQLQLKLTQKLSPQQIQLMKLVQLPTLAFEEKVKQELEENPALEMGKDEEFSDYDDEYNSSEEDYSDNSYDVEQDGKDDLNIDDYLSEDEIQEYKMSENPYSSNEDEMFEQPYRAEVSFSQFIENQIYTFKISDEDMDIAIFLAGNIDDDGYIRRDLSKISDDLAFTQNIYVDEKKIEDILKKVIFQLEPAGIGARNLQECLIIQLEKKKKTEYVNMAIDIIRNNFDIFIKKHYDKLCHKYGISEQELQKIVDEIEKLNPKPGAGYGDSFISEQIIPDFTIRVSENGLELYLNSINSPELHISKEYISMLESYKDSKNKSKHKDAVAFIKKKLDSAKWFIDAIKQREETLYVTMKAIMDVQEEYLMTGDEQKMKPLILRDVADKVGLDISTISRVASSKYVNTPYGTKLIKEFFSESLKNDLGDEVSTYEIKNILKDIIDSEDKTRPLPDEELTEILKNRGYVVARRTVAKYREVLNIPVARLRKQINNK